MSIANNNTTYAMESPSRKSSKENISCDVVGQRCYACDSPPYASLKSPSEETTGSMILAPDKQKNKNQRKIRTLMLT